MWRRTPSGDSSRSRAVENLARTGIGGPPIAPRLPRERSAAVQPATVQDLLRRGDGGAGDQSILRYFPLQGALEDTETAGSPWACAMPSMRVSGQAPSSACGNARRTGERTRSRLRLLKDWRAKEANRLKLSPFLLWPTTSLARLSTTWTDGLDDEMESEEVRRWQRQELGEALWMFMHRYRAGSC